MYSVISHHLNTVAGAQQQQAMEGTTTAGDVLLENTNSLNSIFKFEHSVQKQYSISEIFEFMQPCRNKLTLLFKFQNSCKNRLS